MQNSSQNDDVSILYNDIFYWKGFGGKLKLSSGNCHLIIFCMPDIKNVVHYFKYIAVVWDTPPETQTMRATKMTVRSCAAHVATQVVKKFNIPPQKLLWVEYYPKSTYGQFNEKIIPEIFERVIFNWKNNIAFDPQLIDLSPALLKLVKQLFNDNTRCSCFNT